MEYITDFIKSVQRIGSYEEVPHIYEKWRRETIPYEDKYMNGLFSNYLSSFIKGYYQVVSPFNGEWVRSSFTIVSRGGGHKGERGNTGLFLMWGFVDSLGNIFVIGSMDVFGWITHFIFPEEQIYHVIVPNDGSDWYKPPFKIKDLHTIINERKDELKKRKKIEPSRSIFLGSSESAGHAIWNDLTGLYTYSRQAALNGFSIKGYRLPFTMLGDSISNDELRHITNFEDVVSISKEIETRPYLIHENIFKPLDFVINLRRMKNSLKPGKANKEIEIKSLGIKKKTDSITIWANIRSPMEVKRGVCTNYAKVLIQAAGYLRQVHGFKYISLKIDGWTGKTEPDEYASKVQEHHLVLAKLLEKDCNNVYNEINNLVCTSTLEKLKSSLHKTTQNSISICQYGSGIIYGSVMANDMAIVMDIEPFKGVGSGYDAILGRRDIVHRNRLKLVYVKTKQNEKSDSKTFLHDREIDKIKNELKPNCAYYVLEEKYLYEALDSCLLSKNETSCKYIDASKN